MEKFSAKDLPDNATLPEVIRYLRDQAGRLERSIVYVRGLTWTPTDASGAGLTLAGVSATYDRIDRTVIARCAFTYPATADASNAVIGGLPFAVASGSDARQGFVSYSDETTLRYALPVANGTTVLLLTSAGAAITNATMSGNAVFFTALYRTSA